MSNSLRDQLVKAGFKDKGNERKNTQSTVHGATNNSSKKTRKSGAKRKTSSTVAASAKDTKTEAEQAAAQAHKKAIKGQIKQLIEDNKVADHGGSVTYSYQVGNRVKQLFVNEECQKGLANASLIITRLNGSTYLIPPAIGEQIKKLNPDWALIGMGSTENSEHAKSDAEYADYQVPDDLNW